MVVWLKSFWLKSLQKIKKLCALIFVNILLMCTTPLTVVTSRKCCHLPVGTAWCCFHFSLEPEEQGTSGACALRCSNQKQWSLLFFDVCHLTRFVNAYQMTVSALMIPAGREFRKIGHFVTSFCNFAWCYIWV